MLEIYWFITYGILIAMIAFQSTIIKKRKEQIAQAFALAEKANKLSDKAIERAKKAKERELYLLKAINDATKVTSPMAFIAQRISIAPKEWRKESGLTDKILNDVTDSVD